jgi:hypothetical protein
VCLFLLILGSFHDRMEKWWLSLENHSSTLFSQPTNRELRRGGLVQPKQTKMRSPDRHATTTY